MEQSPYSWYNSKPAKDEISTVGKTPVDARVKGGQFTLCEFAGNHESSDGKRYCKHYLRSQHRTCCMYWCKDFKDDSIPPTYGDKSVTLSRCDFIERG